MLAHAAARVWEMQRRVLALGEGGSGLTPLASNRFYSRLSAGSRGTRCKVRSFPCRRRAERSLLCHRQRCGQRHAGLKCLLLSAGGPTAASRNVAQLGAAAQGGAAAAPAGGSAGRSCRPMPPDLHHPRLGLLLGPGSMQALLAALDTRRASADPGCQAGTSIEDLVFDPGQSQSRAKRAHTLILATFAVCLYHLLHSNRHHADRRCPLLYRHRAPRCRAHRRQGAHPQCPSLMPCPALPGQRLTAPTDALRRAPAR